MLYGGSVIPQYGRVSLVLTSVLLIIVALQVTKKAPAIIKELAVLTLGIYLLHIPVITFLENDFHELYIVATYTRVEFFLVVFVMTAIITYLIKRTGVV
jgi:surface polysaccharide O-acyltransferase-like enzyme